MTLLLDKYWERKLSNSSGYNKKMKNQSIFFSQQDKSNRELGFLSLFKILMELYGKYI